MKLTALSLLALALSVHAENSLTVTGVHNCCKGCDNGIIKAVQSVEGAKASTKGEEVTISAKSPSNLKKAIQALLAAGYAGEGASAELRASAATPVKTISVSGLHLCCGKCVKAADKAIMSVTGVSKHNATKGAKTITVEGEFSPQALIAALNKEGLNGTLK